MKKLVLLAFGSVCAFAGGVTPDGPCPTATVQEYLNTFSRSTGSWCGQDPFASQVVAWNNFGSKTVPASDVNLSPTAQPGTVGFNIFSAITPNVFFVDNGGNIEVHFDYTIDPTRTPVLNGASLSIGSTSPTGDGTAKVTAFICAGALLDNSCDGGINKELVVEDFGHNNPANILTATVDFGKNVSLVDFRLVILLQANHGTSDIASISSGADLATPEPASGLMLLGGLAGLLVLRSRRTRLS